MTYRMHVPATREKAETSIEQLVNISRRNKETPRRRGVYAAATRQRRGGNAATTRRQRGNDAAATRRRRGGTANAAAARGGNARWQRQLHAGKTLKNVLKILKLSCRYRNNQESRKEGRGGCGNKEGGEERFEVHLVKVHERESDMKGPEIRTCRVVVYRMFMH